MLRFLQIVANLLGVLAVVQKAKVFARGEKACIPLPPVVSAAWAINKTRKAMTAFNLDPTPESKRSARAWAKRLDYDLGR